MNSSENHHSGECCTVIHGLHVPGYNQLDKIIHAGFEDGPCFITNCHSVTLKDSESSLSDLMED